MYAQRGFKQSDLTICQFVSPVKIVEISTFTGLNMQLLYVAVTLESKKNVCVPDRDENSSLLCISSSFYLTLVLSTILIRSSTWIQWKPSICGLQVRVRVRIWAGAWEQGYTFD